MEESVSRALTHMFTFMRPTVYISDELHREEGPFMKPLRDRVRQQSRTLIELPGQGGSKMMWMARLDAAALSGKVPSSNVQACN